MKTLFFLLENDPRINVILCDLNLSGISGRHLYETACVEYPEQAKKFAFLTGDRGRKETHEYLQNSGQGFLYKPFEPDELLNLVYRVIGS